MGILKRKSARWAAINFAGMALYLWLASSLWVRPGDEGTPGGPGDAFYQLFALIPVLCIFAAFNLIALISVIRSAIRYRHFYPAFVWLTVVVLWAVVIGYDRYKAFTVIDPAYV